MELSVVSTIIMVAGGLAVGNFVKLVPEKVLEGGRSQVMLDLRLARSAAIHYNTDSQLTFDNAQDKYTIWTDQDHDGVVDGGEVIVRTLDAGLDLWGYPTTGSFNPQGAFVSSISYGYVSLISDAGTEVMHLTANGHIGDYLNGN